MQEGVAMRWSLFTLWFASLSLAHAAPGPAQCTALANLPEFPITPTRITLTQFNEATATLPAHCRVQGILEERTDELAAIITATTILSIITMPIAISLVLG